MFTQLDLSLALVQSLLSIYIFLPFEMGMFTLSIHVYIVYVFLAFDLYRRSQPRVCIESQMRMWTGNFGQY